MHVLSLLATSTTTTTRCFDTCVQIDCVNGTNYSISCPTTTTACPTTIATVATTIKDCSSVEAELFRTRLGLGLGLGAGMAVTTGLAIGSYVYFSSR